MSGFKGKLATGKLHVLTIAKLASQTCTELPGPHFDFDRSFVKPEGVAALGKVQAQLDADPKRKGMLFGHTDTVGTEDYNKLLSERRARAALAVLTHDADLWEKLSNEEKWGLKAVQSMLNAVLEPAEPLDPDGKDGPKTKAAVKEFQRRPDHAPLQDDGIAGPKTRHELALAYFKKGVPAPVAKDRFVDFGGERSMGCGEFNPFTPNETVDEKSRRVVAIVFDPGAKPEDLPCRAGNLGPCRANLRKEGEAPPDPKNPFFRCKLFAKIAARCPKTPPVKPGVGGWELPGAEPDPGTVDSFPDAGWVADGATPEDATIDPLPDATWVGGAPVLPENATIDPIPEGTWIGSEPVIPELGTFEHPAGTIAVRLIDDAGDPIKNVPLATPGGEAGTDADGIAILPGAAGTAVRVVDDTLLHRLRPLSFDRPFVPRDKTTWATLPELRSGVTAPSLETTVTLSTRVAFTLSVGDLDAKELHVRARGTKLPVVEGVVARPHAISVHAWALGDGTVLEVFVKKGKSEHVLATLDLDGLARSGDDPAKDRVALGLETKDEPPPPLPGPSQPDPIKPGEFT